MKQRTPSAFVMLMIAKIIVSTILRSSGTEWRERMGRSIRPPRMAEMVGAPGKSATNDVTTTKKSSQFHFCAKYAFDAPHVPWASIFMSISIPPRAAGVQLAVPWAVRILNDVAEVRHRQRDGVQEDEEEDDALKPFAFDQRHQEAPQRIARG
eukprot:scaffold4678_cov242-Pinguiococcus_pyrenoidosus.AAC.9